MIIGLSALSLLLGIGGAFFVSRLGFKLGLIDVPTDRSSHVFLTPKGGGIGILASSVLICLLLGIPVLFWLPLFLISIFSFLGDKFEFSPFLRLAIQFCSATAIILGYIHLKPHDIFGIILFLFLSFFIVGTANIYNFMDGINGIAAITGISVFGLLSYGAFNIPFYSRIGILSLCIMFSCLGFLPFNLFKARVFMGDGGSIFLGFSFASIAIKLSNSLTDFICMVSFLFLFYTDEITTVFVRLKDKENFFLPHRRHLYQIFCNEKKIPHWKVSFAYGIIQFLIGITVLIFRPMGIFPILSLLSVYFVTFAYITYRVRKGLNHGTGICAQKIQGE